MTMADDIKSYKDLQVWQKALELVVSIYEITEKYPREELYGLTSQTRRAAVSIPANIAEGRRNGSKKEFVHFLSIAYGSASELETHIAIAKALPFGSQLNFTEIEQKLTEILKMLGTMRKKLNAVDTDI
jgi:four helix bundle protein